MWTESISKNNTAVHNRRTIDCFDFTQLKCAKNNSSLRFHVKWYFYFTKIKPEIFESISMCQKGMYRYYRVNYPSNILDRMNLFTRFANGILLVIQAQTQLRDQTIKMIFISLELYIAFKMIKENGDIKTRPQMQVHNDVIGKHRILGVF